MRIGGGAPPHHAASAAGAVQSFTVKSSLAVAIMNGSHGFQHTALTVVPWHSSRSRNAFFIFA